MKILTQSISIIDYENNETYVRTPPREFSEYIKQVINYIEGNKNVRKYKTSSNSTEVIGCILNIINNLSDEENIENQFNKISHRLLLKEIEAQENMEHRLNQKIQKGSLIQALLQEDGDGSYKYLLAKVEHTDFIDDIDYSFKTGFSKNKKILWKSCIFKINNLDDEIYFADTYATDYLAKYWVSSFLELTPQNNDEYNTARVFKAIKQVLNSSLKKTSPKDCYILKNATGTYFKTHNIFDFQNYKEEILEKYEPIEMDKSKIGIISEKINDMLERRNYDKQFEIVSSLLDKEFKSTYNVITGVQLKITDESDEMNRVITGIKDSEGNMYLKIKTDSEEVFNNFVLEE